MNEAFERGVASFNRRAYFEAHEIWEDLWQQAEARDKEFLAALIQLAAALHLRFERGGSRGTRNLLVQALTTLEKFRPSFQNIDVDKLYAELTSYAERVKEKKQQEAGWLDRWLAPRIVVI